MKLSMSMKMMMRMKRVQKDCERNGVLKAVEGYSLASVTPDINSARERENSFVTTRSSVGRRELKLGGKRIIKKGYVFRCFRYSSQFSSR